MPEEMEEDLHAAMRELTQDAAIFDAIKTKDSALSLLSRATIADSAGGTGILPLKRSG